MAEENCTSHLLIIHLFNTFHGNVTFEHANNVL